MRILLPFVLLVVLAMSLPAVAAEQPFKDVPKDHWAAEYVAKVASDGIMKGYPNSTFKGEKAVTRYELAVALERMIEVVENALKPELDKQPKAAPSPQPSPRSDSVSAGNAKAQGEGANKSTTPQALSKPRPGAVSKGDPAQALKAGGYIAADSPLLTNRDKAVTPTELAQALSSVAAKLIEKTIPPPKE